MKKLIAVMVLLFAVLFVLNACRADTKPTDNTTVPTDTAERETHGFFKSDVEKFEIETPYAILQYPKKWEDRVVVEKTDGDYYSVAFYAISEGGNIRIFDIVFGEDPDMTFPLGILKSSKGDVAVSIVDYSGEAVKLAPEDLVSDIYEMSEDMNEVISGLVYNYGLEVR